MEKYRKFEDARNGINPFLPDITGNKNFLINFLFFFKILIGIPILITFLILFIIFTILQSLRHFLIFSKVKRITEVFFCKIFGKIFLILMGLWNINNRHGKLDQRTPNIIFSSQSSIIDWIILMYRYSPKFLWIVKSQNSENDYLVELNYCDLLFYSAGLKFLLNKNNKHSKSQFDIEKYVSSTNHVPLVIFPENTKSNRKGVLSIRSNVMNLIYKMVNEHQRLLLRSEIVVKKLNYYSFSPHNTTDYYGFSRLFFICSQLWFEVDVISQDILNSNLDKSQLFDKLKFNKVEEYLDTIVQEYLYEPKNRNLVKFY